ncbi:hypothetical protein BDV98DRAFT_595409 [Pterulicium gracile]|uniref:Uncharacterized protein n=1 Tax=Pterulicium gracile TaxID=1884261 RepID=A0A5C3QK54_9AGAR|nr:hypothetical protein BDV98DRAFT_595409 [Pterula gracilis]
MPTVYIFPQQFFAILDTLFPKVRTFFPFIISSGIAPAKFEGLRCDDASIATRNLIIHAFRYERFEAPGVTSIPIKLMRKAYNGLYEIASMGVTALPAGFEGKSRLYQHVGKNVALPAVAIHRKPSKDAWSDKLMPHRAVCKGLARLVKIWGILLHEAEELVKKCAPNCNKWHSQGPQGVNGATQLQLMALEEGFHE